MRTDAPHTPAPARDLFAATHPPETAEPAREGFSGLVIWVIAALCLVAGIVVGFASGYTAGRRAAVAAAAPAADDPLPELSPPVDRRDEPAAFSEGTVAEPVRVDPPPIVPEPAEPAAEPVTPPPRAAAPRPPAPRTAPRVDPEAARARVASPASPATAPAPAAAGTLQVLSRPSGATVTVDGQIVGRTPLVISNVRPGGHDVGIELAGFRRWSTSVDVRPGARARVAASLEQ